MNARPLIRTASYLVAAAALLCEDAGGAAAQSTPTPTTTPAAAVTSPALPAATSVSFPSSQPGLSLTGLLYRPTSPGPSPAIVIMSGTSGKEGFQNWEIPWALRLQRAGYVALVVDSFTARGLGFADHWRLPMVARGQDALDAGRFLASQPFVNAHALGVIGRSGGGTAVLAAVVQRTGHPHAVPFKAGVALYGYCQEKLGDWPGGTPTNASAANAFRTSIPLLIAIGTKDTHVPPASCQALAASAKRVGSPVTLLVFPGADHAFDTLYGNGTPAQQAQIINAIGGLIAKDVAAAPSGTAIHVTAADFSSHVGQSNLGTLVFVMQPGRGAGSAGGKTTLSGTPSGVTFAINLAESSSSQIAQIRQGSCAQIYPEVAYTLGTVVDGTAAGTLPNVGLGELQNGHYAVVVVANANATQLSSCGDIPSST